MRFLFKGSKASQATTLLGALALVLSTSALQPSTAEATPPKQLTGTVIASGLLQNDFSVKLKSDDGQKRNIKDVRKIVTIKFEIEPGGHFGWHSHGGPLWGIITQGEVTLHRSATKKQKKDGPCSSRSYGAGETLFDPGDINHIGVNSGTDTVIIYATLMLPIDGLPRIDQPDPGTCGVF